MYKPTNEELQALQDKHGDIFVLTVEDKCCVMRTPDRKTLSYASASAAKDPLSFNDVILKKCFLAGDEEIKNDDAYFLGASAQVEGLIQVKESSLEKFSGKQK